MKLFGVDFWFEGRKKSFPRSNFPKIYLFISQTISILTIEVFSVEELRFFFVCRQLKNRNLKTIFSWWERIFSDFMKNHVVFIIAGNMQHIETRWEKCREFQEEKRYFKNRHSRAIPKYRELGNDHENGAFRSPINPSIVTVMFDCVVLAYKLTQIIVSTFIRWSGWSMTRVRVASDEICQWISDLMNHKCSYRGAVHQA